MTLEFTVDPELTGELRVQIAACWADVTNAGGSVGFIPPVTVDDLQPATARALASVAAGYDRLLIGRETESPVTGPNAGIDTSTGIGIGTDTRISPIAGAGVGTGIGPTAGIGDAGVRATGIGTSTGTVSTNAGVEIGVQIGGGRLAALAFITDEQTPVTRHLRVVKRVMVHPDFQGRGYGSLLMAEVERTARAMGVELLALDCRGGTGNDEFYKKNGYVEYGRLPGALLIGPGEYRGRVLMALPLKG